MNKIKMTLIGLLVMVTFVVAPVYAASDTATDTGTSSQSMDQTGAGSSSDQMGAGSSSDQMGQMAQGSQQSAIRVSQLMDKSVQDEQGKDIGKVSDVVIGQDGKAEFIVLSQGGGFLGTGGGGELKPIPWDKVQTQNIGQDQNAITVSVNQDQLQNAPSFSKNDWQSFTQGDMNQQVRGYYGSQGAQPSQQDQMMQDTGQSGSQSGQPSDMQMDQQGQQGTQQEGQ